MTLSDVGAERIYLLYHVAKRHGSLVSVQELSRLLPERTTERELAEVIASIPSLSSRFELRAGYLTERPGGPEPDPSESEARNRRTARINMEHAARFVSLLHTSPFKMVAVSGSTSYGSASRSKDLDLFCVAPTGRMWFSLTHALLMARVFSLLRPDAPQVCLSCVMDEDFARSAFTSQDDPLFARDALATKVVRGRAFYQSLLSMAKWISAYYPHAYDRAATPNSPRTRRSQPSALDVALNRLFFVTIGRFLGLKSLFLNRRLRAAGRGGDVFETRIGEDHLIYESGRYAALRREYRAVLGPGTSVQN